MKNIQQMNRGLAKEECNRLLGAYDADRIQLAVEDSLSEIRQARVLNPGLDSGRALIQEIARRVAIGHLYRQEDRRVQAICFGVLNPPYRHLVPEAKGETFLRLTRQFTNGGIPESPKAIPAYIARCAVNTSKNVKRGEKRYRLRILPFKYSSDGQWEEPEKLKSDYGTIAKHIERNIELRQRLEFVQASLEETDRLILTLALQEFSQKDIAAILDMDYPRQKSTISKRLKKILALVIRGKEPPDGSGGSSGGAGSQGGGDSGESPRNNGGVAAMTELTKTAAERAAHHDELARLLLQLPAYNETGFWEDCDDDLEISEAREAEKYHVVPAELENELPAIAEFITGSDSGEEQMDSSTSSLLESERKASTASGEAESGERQLVDGASQDTNHGQFEIRASAGTGKSSLITQVFKLLRKSHTASNLTEVEHSKRNDRIGVLLMRALKKLAALLGFVDSASAYHIPPDTGWPQGKSKCRTDARTLVKETFRLLCHAHLRRIEFLSIRRYFGLVPTDHCSGAPRTRVFERRIRLTFYQLLASCFNDGLVPLARMNHDFVACHSKRGNLRLFKASDHRRFFRLQIEHSEIEDTFNDYCMSLMWLLNESFIHPSQHVDLRGTGRRQTSCQAEARSLFILVQEKLTHALCLGRAVDDDSLFKLNAQLLDLLTQVDLKRRPQSLGIRKTAAALRPSDTRIDGAILPLLPPLIDYFKRRHDFRATPRKPSTLRKIAFSPSQVRTPERTSPSLRPLEANVFEVESTCYPEHTFKEASCFLKWHHYLLEMAAHRAFYSGGACGAHVSAVAEHRWFIPWPVDVTSSQLGEDQHHEISKDIACFRATRHWAFVYVKTKTGMVLAPDARQQLVDGALCDLWSSLPTRAPVWSLVCLRKMLDDRARQRLRSALSDALWSLSAEDRSTLVWHYSLEPIVRPPIVRYAIPDDDHGRDTTKAEPTTQALVALATALESKAKHRGDEER